MKSLFASAGRVLLTLVSLLVAIAVGWQLWSYYMLEPWTRDGRVRADVVTVAADVSGLVSDVFVHDNEKVTKGQPLFRIDQRRFQYALEQAKASVDSRQVNLDRSTVLAPVNGIVTKFQLLPGRYVNAGAPVFALIDSDSFRVEGYFEETKLRRIHIGEAAEVKLIGDPR